jgi:hypothetical protein
MSPQMDTTGHEGPASMDILSGENGIFRVGTPSGGKPRQPAAIGKKG